MSSAVSYSAFKTFLDENWTTTPLRYDNAGMSPELDGSGNPVPWVLVEVVGNTLDQVSFGAGTAAANRWREQGQLLLYVFVESGSGSLLARQYADDLMAMFRGLELDPDIWCGDMTYGPGAPSDDGLFWCFPVIVDWYRAA